MSEPFNFTTTLFGMEVDVAAEINPGKIDPFNRVPPEYPEAYDIEVTLRGEPLDLDGIFVRRFGKDDYTPITERLAILAVEKWEESR